MGYSEKTLNRKQQKTLAVGAESLQGGPLFIHHPSNSDGLDQGLIGLNRWRVEDIATLVALSQAQCHLLGVVR